MALHCVAESTGVLHLEKTLTADLPSHSHEPPGPQATKDQKRHNPIDDDDDDDDDDDGTKSECIASVSEDSDLLLSVMIMNAKHVRRIM